MYHPSRFSVNGSASRIAVDRESATNPPALKYKPLQYLPYKPLYHLMNLSTLGFLATFKPLNNPITCDRIESGGPAATANLLRGETMSAVKATKKEAVKVAWNKIKAAKVTTEPAPDTVTKTIKDVLKDAKSIIRVKEPEAKEAKVAVTKAIGKAAKELLTPPKTKTKETRLCLCGCGNNTSGPKTFFRMGHDARTKSQMLQVIAGKTSPDTLSDELINNWKDVQFIIDRPEFHKLMASIKK